MYLKEHLLRQAFRYGEMLLSNHRTVRVRRYSRCIVHVQSILRLVASRLLTWNGHLALSDVLEQIVQLLL